MEKHRTDHHCKVKERRQLVSEMTQCDHQNSSQDKYKCYLDATKESREKKSCTI